MNTSVKRSFFIFFLLTACFFMSANAQRNRADGGQRGNSYSNRNDGNSSTRSSGDFNRQRSFDRSPGYNGGNPVSVDRRTNDRMNNSDRINSNNDRISNDRINNTRISTGRINADSRVADVNRNNQSGSFRRSSGSGDANRDVVANSSRTSNFDFQRNNRTIVINNNVRYNSFTNYNRYPRIYNYDHSGGYSFIRYNYYAPRRYVYVGAPRYSVLPRTFISIDFGGYPYYYYGGGFYSHYGGYYEPVFAPIGIHIRILPVGYYPIYTGPNPYYYYEGVYYRKYQDREEYEVVDAPMGAIVSKLPKGATVATVNGEKFYEFNGTYYKENTNGKNEVQYTVVGKNGNINNTEEPATNNTVQAPQIGDEITVLPENSKQVTINGDTLYVTPDNLYLKAETRNDTTTYKVVGRAENN